MDGYRSWLVGVLLSGWVCSTCLVSAHSGSPVPGVCLEIQKAIEAFFYTYERLPEDRFEPERWQSLGIERRSTLILRGLTGETGPLSREMNPQRIPFLSRHDCDSCKADTLCDSWCQPYLILLDDDGVGLIRFRDKEIQAKAIAWSTGPNGVNEWGGGDDICGFDQTDLPGLHAGHILTFCMGLLVLSLVVQTIQWSVKHRVDRVSV